jgi:phage tail-like protein
MDANGQRVWMLAGERDWAVGSPPTVRWDGSRRTLRLAGRRILPEAVATPDPAAVARARLGQPRAALDAFGGRAFWHPGAGTVRAAHPDLTGDVPLFTPPDGQAPDDLCAGQDGVLYMAVAGRVVLRDPRDRWEVPPLAAADLAAWRLAPRTGGGVWVLDRANRRLGRVRGLPLPRRPEPDWDPGTWRPDPEDPDPPRLTRLFDLELAAGEEPVALAASPRGQLALLTWAADGAARLRLLREEEGRLGFDPPLELRRGDDRALAFPWLLAWLSEERLAVLVPGLDEAPAYDLAAGMVLQPAGDLYPLRDHDGGPFLNGPAPVPYYLTSGGQSVPLRRLSLPAFPAAGSAAGAGPCDSGRAGTEWHRLYLEAAIPPGCGVRVRLAANDQAGGPPADWYEHRFGRVPGEPGRIPRGAWVPFPSESPFHPGLLPCPPERDRAGLFTALIQRAGRRVTALTGRYLWVEVELLGDGRTTPEVAALRAWGSRFSYVDRYLPELYHEEALGPERDDPAPATPADFLERFLASFESILTPLEDRIAASYLLTDPRTVPEDALEWLGSWIGMSFEPGLPAERRRALLRAAPELHRWRGTLRGLRQALDVSTGGGVSRGDVVVLEEFRLRRTFATILGVDLTDQADPLLGGLSVSGNSIVGDTLFLGEENGGEFLALFGADLPKTPAEERAVQLFFERLAHRVAILVHQEVEPQDLGLIRRVAGAEAPAHVEVRVFTASSPFLVGAASLVGVDTYLAPEPAPQPVAVGRSVLGLRDFLLGPASLDPRLTGGDPFAGSPPVADAGGDRQVEPGQSFVLDASRSHAFGGRRIVRYHWTLVESS